MRFVNFSRKGVETAGLRLGDEVVDLSLAAPRLPRSLLDLVTEGRLEEAAALAQAAPAEHRLPLAQAPHIALLPRPPKMVNMFWHPGQGKRGDGGFSFSVSTRLCGHGQAMLAPKGFAQLDYGVELAVILSKGGRHIPVAQAASHIAGYSILNDGWVRDFPEGEHYAVERNFDRTAPFGPELVTVDELPPLARGLKMVMRRNGVIVQSGMTDMTWPVDEAIARVSAEMTLEDGDVLTMGAVGGRVFDDPTVGYLREGDVLEAEIEGIGTLRNAVIAEA